MYAPSKYHKHPARCSNCRTNFVPLVENPPRPTTSGLRVDCPQCGHDFIWSLPGKFTVRCSECGLTALLARRKPEWDDSGAYAVPCPSDACDGHLRTPEWHESRRRQRERRERDEQPPDVEELPESWTPGERPPSGAVELPLRREPTGADENRLPPSRSEVEKERWRKLNRIRKRRRRRDRY